MEKKEAMKILKDFHDKSALFSVRTALNTVIPELKESEDKIMKELIYNIIVSTDYTPSSKEIFSVYGKTKGDVLAWLEKQGNKTMDCRQNHPDSNRPNGCIVLEDFNEGEGFYKLHLDYLNKKQIEEVEEMVRMWNHEQKPTEEYNITGIGSKKAQGKLGEMIKNLNPVNEILEQNPACSEEDKEMINNIIDYMIPMPIFFESTNGKSGKEYTQEFVKNAIKWLKSLKERIGNFDDGYKVGFSAAKHNQWKPSDEQMERLRGIINSLPHQEVLYSLYQDLKKLK